MMRLSFKAKFVLTWLAGWPLAAWGGNYVFIGESPDNPHDWFDGRNWSLNGVPNMGVPGPNDSAAIGTGQFQVTASMPVTVQNLALTDFAVLGGPGDVTVKNVFDFISTELGANPSLAGPGSLILNQGADMNVKGTCGVSCAVSNSGQILLFTTGGVGAATLALDSGAVLFNGNLGTIQLQNSTAINGAGSIINNGTILMNDSSSYAAFLGESRSIPGPNLLNNGLVEVADGGILWCFPALGNTNLGEYQANGALYLHASNYFQPTATITGSGTCQSDGYVRVTGSGSSGPTVTGNFEMDAGYLDNSGAGNDVLTIANSGQFLWKGGTLNTICSNGGDATLNMSGPLSKNMDSFGTILNSGHAFWTGVGYILDVSGNPASKAAFYNSASLVASNDAVMGVPFYNGGTFRKEGGATNASTTFQNYQGQGGSLLVDQGTVTINSGTLAGVSLFGFPTQPDVLSVEQDGAILEFAGGTVFIDGQANISSTSGSGVTIHPGAIVNITNGGQMNVDGNLHVAGNQINGPGRLNMKQGTLFWEGGNISANTAINQGSVMVVTNNAGQGFQNCIVTNEGLITIEGNFDVTDSEIYNEPTGTMLVTAPAEVGGPTNSTIENQGTLIVQSNAQTTVDVSVRNTGFLELAGEIYLVHGLEQSAGTLNFTSNGIIKLPTLMLDGGGLTGNNLPGFGINGNVIANSANISPGNSPGVLWINGNYTSTSNTMVTIQLGGLAAGTQYDQLNISGTATLDGMLAVSLINGFVPVAGNQFTIMTFQAHNGVFPVKNGLNVGGGLFLMPVYTATNLTLVAANSTSIQVNLGFIPGTSSNGFQLTWLGVAGQSYQVEESPDLIHWYRLTNLVGSGSALNFLDPGSVTNPGPAYYRLH